MTQDSNANDLIDLDRYPLDRPGSVEFSAMIGRLREALTSVGCAVIKGFIRAKHMPALVAEAERVAPMAYRSFNRTNAYFTQDDPGKSDTHPVRRFYQRSNAFVPADNFGPESLLRTIYEWPAFGAFVQAALDEQAFYPYADPLADVIINVVEPGGGFPWHFDTNNYTVALAIQDAQRGGLFEFCPYIRSSESENYEGVQSILDGESKGVESITLEGGDLQIFKGRYTLHRVTAVEGNRNRHVAIFSFAEIPDMVANPERCKQLYGRVLPVHLEHARRRSDTLLD